MHGSCTRIVDRATDGDRLTKSIDKSYEKNPLQNWKIELLKELADQAIALHDRDEPGLDALIRRARLYIEKVFGDSSRYIEDLNSIPFHAQNLMTGETSPQDQLEAWYHGRERIKNLITIMSKDVEISSKVESSSTQELEDRPAEDRRKVWVVHGRDHEARDELCSWLRTINLNPIPWSEPVDATGSGSPYIGAVLQKAFSEAQAFIILMTPDDEGHVLTKFLESEDPVTESELTPQVRQNVIFEAGMALGIDETKTILVKCGVLRPFSNAIGRHVIDLGKEPGWREDLKKRLEGARCHVKTEGSDWLTVGNFNPLPDAGGDKENQTRERPISEIDFARLNEVPLDDDVWIVKAQNPEQNKPNLEPVPDHNYGCILQIRSNGKYYMDRKLDDIEASATVVEYIIRPSKYATVYVEVKVKNEDGTHSDVWLATRAGKIGSRRQLTPYDKEPEIEWTAKIPSTRVTGGWNSVRFDVPALVEDTFGKNGQAFVSLVSIRLRNDMELAKISFYK